MCMNVPHQTEEHQELLPMSIFSYNCIQHTTI